VVVGGVGPMVLGEMIFWQFVCVSVEGPEVFGGTYLYFTVGFLFN
jgi:hypothetical protein